MYRKLDSGPTTIEVRSQEEKARAIRRITNMYRKLDNVLRNGPAIIEVRSQEDLYSLMDELDEREYYTVAHANGFPAYVGIMDRDRVFFISHGLRTAPDMVWGQ